MKERHLALILVIAALVITVIGLIVIYRSGVDDRDDRDDGRWDTEVTDFDIEYWRLLSVLPCDYPVSGTRSYQTGWEYGWLGGPMDSRAPRGSEFHDGYADGEEAKRRDRRDCRIEAIRQE